MTILDIGKVCCANINNHSSRAEREPEREARGSLWSCHRNLAIVHPANCFFRRSLIVRKTQSHVRPAEQNINNPHSRAAGPSAKRESDFWLARKVVFYQNPKIGFKNHLKCPYKGCTDSTFQNRSGVIGVIVAGHFPFDILKNYVISKSVWRHWRHCRRSFSFRYLENYVTYVITLNFNSLIL